MKSYPSFRKLNQVDLSLPNESLSVHHQNWQQLRALTGAERRSLEAVLIHRHRARLVPV
jgi:hypothetical protein